VSAVGVADFNHVSMHEAYIDVLRRFSADPFTDIVEYLTRGITDLALGNPDNHDRNAALGKHPDGTIRLSPLFDFTPMRLAREGIVRSTRWASMRDDGRDHLSDWKHICAELMMAQDEEIILAAALSTFAERLGQASEMAQDVRAPLDIQQRAMGRCVETADSVLATCSLWVMGALYGPPLEAHKRAGLENRQMLAERARIGGMRLLMPLRKSAKALE